MVSIPFFSLFEGKPILWREARGIKMHVMWLKEMWHVISIFVFLYSQWLLHQRNDIYCKGGFHVVFILLTVFYFGIMQIDTFRWNQDYIIDLFLLVLAYWEINSWLASCGHVAKYFGILEYPRLLRGKSLLNFPCFQEHDISFLWRMVFQL